MLKLLDKLEPGIVD
jgi:plastin-1